MSVIVVANSWMRIPDDRKIALEIVGDDPDAADDWIAERIQSDDIVITADIPLAHRCLKNEGHVITPYGRRLTENNIGEAVATRDLMTELRSAGEKTGGPPPLKKSDRSQFLQQLDNVIQSIKRSISKKFN